MNPVVLLQFLTAEWGIAVFSTLVWGLVPPLALLLIYQQRVKAAPPLKGLLCLFGCGMVAACLAIGLSWVVDWMIQPLPDLRLWHQSMVGMMFYQIGILAPIEEGCKLLAVVLPMMWVIWRYERIPAQPSTVLLATIAVAAGFAAQKSLIALWTGRWLVVNHLVSSLMQIWCSLPWGLAIGFGIARLLRHQDYAKKLVLHGWLAACICHASWNCIWLLSEQPGELNLIAPWVKIAPHHLLYGLFAWGLWLWWQTEGMLARSQNEPAYHLITGTTLRMRLQGYGVILIAICMGSIAVTSLFNFGRSLQFTWALRTTFDREMGLVLVQELLRALGLGVIGLYLFRQRLRARS
jgi:RsiW-degrading membrane proteinase PrsW (M82 family)